MSQTESSARKNSHPATRRARLRIRAQRRGIPFNVDPEQYEAVMSAKPDWMTLGELEPGALFETRTGTCAVKSEYRYPNGQCECVLLSSGEYAHFKEGNSTEVREIQLGRHKCR